jgi:hypothetical protein
MKKKTIVVSVTKAALTNNHEMANINFKQALRTNK